ncbi:methionine ABC transporter ATP-binding protein [Isachenkonia alkalipeptolytica]|uniref:ATP-binding cassette domain-containing protein n=1 Tax=Isachenkonia alkalipeptolytica TaxID=2565777 RepID=A0AA43XMS0_9CLOT|nr:ATP-binding cassette domain-containing protein [Isachenkonia alkalipeptolytica]NBG89422.1 ATP-binding cassette domain-containing protein [Isachenkonia alkalipeptolytica]
MIHFQKISKTYPSKNGGVKALKNVDLIVNAREIFGVIGLSGAGKSTLLRLVNGLETFDEGNLTVDGVNLQTCDKKDLRALRQNTGMIFQHYHLLQHRKVGGNIAFPLELSGESRSKIEKKVDELLEIVDLKEKKHHYPAVLSGGQRQRVAIARALATNPKILLCDEATSSLDPITGKAILSLLEKINRELGITILMISHQLSAVSRICHRVGVLQNGEMIEQGSKEQVLGYPKKTYTRALIESSEIHGKAHLKREVV